MILTAHTRFSPVSGNTQYLILQTSVWPIQMFDVCGDRTRDHQRNRHEPELWPLPQRRHNWCIIIICITYYHTYKLHFTIIICNELDKMVGMCVLVKIAF